MDLAEDYLKFCSAWVLENHRDDLELLASLPDMDKVCACVCLCLCVLAFSTT